MDKDNNILDSFFADKAAFLDQYFTETSLEKSSEYIAINKAPQPPLEVRPDPEKLIIRLPEPDALEDNDVPSFLQMIELRETVRQYSLQPMTQEELSFLLWCTQGVKAILTESPAKTLRTVPSARASHSLETYLLINNVEGLEKGLYRFLALGHAVQQIATGEEVLEDLVDCFLPKNMIKKCGVTFVWTTDFQRIAYGCGARALRYVYNDAGHVCQNLYLAAQQKHIGVCAIGHFEDDKLNSRLGLDGRRSFTVYCATCGKAVV